MFRGGTRQVSAGFTIVETLIVLAVSSALLISAIALIGGRQAKTEFQTSINNAQQQMQQIINETTSGYYPNQGDFTCAAGATGTPTIQSGSGQQGSNIGCVFLGKALQFGLSGSDGNGGSLGVLPVVGRQYKPASLDDPVELLSDALPRALYPAGGLEALVPKTAASSTQLQYGLAVATDNSSCAGVGPVCYVPSAGGSPVATGTAVFLAADSSGRVAAADTGGVASGPSQYSLFSTSWSQPSTSFGSVTCMLGDVPAAVAAVDCPPSPPTSPLASVREMYICLASGVTNQSGLFTIEGDSLNVKLQIMDGLTC